MAISTPATVVCGPGDTSGPNPILEEYAKIYGPVVPDLSWLSQATTLSSFHGLTGKENIPPTRAALESLFDDAVAGVKIPELSHPPALRLRKIGRYVYLGATGDVAEFKAMVTLAGQMKAKGFQAAIAPIAVLASSKFGDLPPGIIVWTSLTPMVAKQAFQAACAGHFNVLIPAEFITLPLNETTYRFRLNQWALEIMDGVYVPSQAQAALWKKITDPQKIMVAEFDWPAKPERIPLDNGKEFTAWVTERLSRPGKKPTAEQIEALRCEAFP